MDTIYRNKPKLDPPIEITIKDLPLSCPLPGEEVWCQHPRVYIAVEQPKQIVKCPYCSKRYILV